jgi:COP9 signalosome complex subunit 3
LIKLSLKLCPNHTHLNSIDADVLQVAISAHMYSVALNYLSLYQFNQLEPNHFPITPVDILRFFYYSGIVYISAKQFQKALESFDQVLAIPAQNISTVAIEAYRKALLVNLIFNGKKYQTPR